MYVFPSWCVCLGVCGRFRVCSFYVCEDVVRTLSRTAGGRKGVAATSCAHLRHFGRPVTVDGGTRKKTRPGQTHICGTSRVTCSVCQFTPHSSPVVVCLRCGLLSCPCLCFCVRVRRCGAEPDSPPRVSASQPFDKSRNPVGSQEKNYGAVSLFGSAVTWLTPQ